MKQESNHYFDVNTKHYQQSISWLTLKTINEHTWASASQGFATAHLLRYSWIFWRSSELVASTTAYFLRDWLIFCRSSELLASTTAHFLRDSLNFCKISELVASSESIFLLRSYKHIAQHHMHLIIIHSTSYYTTRGKLTTIIYMYKKYIHITWSSTSSASFLWASSACNNRNCCLSLCVSAGKTSFWTCRTRKENKILWACKYKQIMS